MVAGAIILALVVGFMLGHKLAHAAMCSAIKDTFTAEEQERINRRIDAWLND
jgi:hypothetical protein